MNDTQDMPEYIGDFSIRSIARSEDVPNELEVNHSLLAQYEIDALRDEVRSLRYNLSLKNGECLRLKDMIDNPQELPKFLGFPFRYYDESDEDCRRLTYQIYYCGQWRDINSYSLSFDKDMAVESIIKLIREEAAK